MYQTSWTKSFSLMSPRTVHCWISVSVTKCLGEEKRVYFKQNGPKSD